MQIFSVFGGPGVLLYRLVGSKEREQERANLPKRSNVDSKREQ
jgi:hypothetical protein